MAKVVIRSTKEQSLCQVTQDVLAACGWTELVKPDTRVVIKPNLVSLDVKMAYAANTSMELLAQVIQILQQRTRHILVGEADMINPPQVCPAERAFEMNGLVEMAKTLDFELVNFSRSPTRPIASPLFKSFEMPVCILDADVLISMPVLKTHKQAYFTGAIKNLWGCVPRYDRFLLHRHLHEHLAELVRILKPQLAIMDAIVGMEGPGPTYGNPRRLDLVLGSTDVVALDVTALRLTSLEPEKARHVRLAHELGLGEWAEERIEIDGDFARNRTTFEPAPYGFAIRMMDQLSPYSWFTHGVLLNPALFKLLSKTSRTLRKLGLLHH